MTHRRWSHLIENRFNRDFTITRTLKMAPPIDRTFEKKKKVKSISVEIRHSNKKMSTQLYGEKLAAPVPQALNAREFMIERLILRDNTREHLRRSGREDEIEHDLLVSTECQCQTNIYDPSQCKCQAREAFFLVAQFYYDLDQFENAWKYYSKVKDVDLRALYQLAVMIFEGVGPKDLTAEDGYRMMHRVATTEKDPHAFVIPYAQFHIGKSHFQGHGATESEEQAESWWLMAANANEHEPVVEAQTALAFFYSRNTSEFYNLKKAFYWHNKASQYGSLESLGAIGAMSMFGIGTGKDIHQAIECLREASERGNVYAMGLLVYAYYMRKLYTKATDLGKKVCALDNIEELARVSCCVPQYIRKGIAIASFILGRCFERGLGVKNESENVISMYKKCFQYDPDVCQLMQDYLTHEKI